MKNCIRLGFAYLKFYKKQTVALFIGIVLSTALLTGIGSLMGSGKMAALENARAKYGDWHYYTRCDLPWFSDFLRNTKGTGYEVEKAGVLTIRKVIEEPYQVMLAYGDETYLDMMGRRVEEGHYPERINEVALDNYTLLNLEIPAKLGSQVMLHGETFILSGILSDLAENDTMQAFVSKDLDYGKNGQFVYLKFDESKKVYRQARALMNTFDIERTALRRNNGIVKYLGGDAKVDLWKTMQTGISMNGAGFPYIWAVLNGEWNLTEKAVLVALGLFGLFTIYSLFQMSVIRRMSEYSTMQAVGMEERVTFGVLFAELFLIALVAYPFGCLLGNGTGRILYQKNGQMFVTPESYVINTGAAEEAPAAAMMSNAGDFHFSEAVAVGGVVFMLLLILLISWILVKRMRLFTTRELLAREDGKRKKNKTIYSQKSASLTGVLTKKFMFARKGTFIGILFSLSAGSLIFLSTTFVTENTKINNELKFKVDDGLGSDMQVLIESDELPDIIGKDTVRQLGDIKDLESVCPVTYMLGEISLLDGQLKWNTFYPEIANEEGREPNPVMMEKYNGLAVQTGQDDYKLKVNIYGYDDQMLKQMDAYLLEGTVNPDKMREQNTVIFKPLMGGQGTYEGIDLAVGDSFLLKTPSDAQASADVLRFDSSEEWYKETSFQIAALSSRPLGRVDTFIGDDGTDRVDIIMTNEQMEKNFQVQGYRTISINLKQWAEASQTADKIKTVVSSVSKCVVKDYTQQIQIQNLYLKQKMMFFYGVALMLLVISLLHIVNSMLYLVTARRHEFGILRAMGITDAGFRRMLLKEGARYGLYSSIVMLILYLLVQKFLYYFIIHVYRYLQPQTSLSALPILVMIGINILICTAAVLVSGEAVLRRQVIQEINE